MPPKIGDVIFNLKLQSKQINKEALKSEKRAGEERVKVKKAIQQGNDEGAKIYAQNAIREKNTYLQFLRLGSKIDGVVSRLQNMQAMGNVVRNLDGLNSALAQAGASFDMNKINKVLSDFEKNMGKIEDQNEVLNEKMGKGTENLIPDDEVTQLIQDVAKENQLVLSEKLGGLNGPIAQGQPQQQLQQNQPQQMLQGQGGGAVPAPGSYGPPPGGYSSPPGFGQPPGGGFGGGGFAQPPGGGFSQPPGGGFSQPPGGGFSQPPGGGYGAPSSGYSPTSGYPSAGSGGLPPPSDAGAPPAEDDLDARLRRLMGGGGS